jgi:aminoglycoside 3-N-acetyltransferase
MNEWEVIKRSTNGPVTVNSLVKDLQNIGVTSGMTLLVHTSLSAMGWVCGGATAVIQALEEVLSDKGTLVMPTHSPELSDPSGWENPPVDESWWQIIRENMPAFDVDITPSGGMGIVAETFRKQQGVLRSNHPQVSFAAWGANAHYVTNQHPLENSFGDESPLGKIYELEGYILSIGVGYSENTSLHLAESQANYPSKQYKKCGAPLRQNGIRRWVNYNDLDYSSDDFLEIGRAYESQSDNISREKLGYASSTLIPQRELVDFAIQWMENNRG